LPRLRTLCGLAISAVAVSAAIALPANASTPAAVHSTARAAQSSAAPFTVRIVNIPPKSRNAVIPKSDSGCVGNLDWDNIQTCVFIDGSGLYVSTMKGVSYVYNYPVLEHVQLQGPSVNYSTLDYWIDQGQYLEVLWTANRDVTAGAYCATSWVANGSGGYDNWGTECQPVHT
jgi:hypothetical protein